MTSKTHIPQPTPQPVGDPRAARRESLIGIGFGLGAFLFWGIAPIYFKLVQHVPAVEILAHRILWSAAFLALLVWVLGRWRGVALAVTDRRLLFPLIGSAVILAANWFVYIVAVNDGQVLQASLGYYINPLVNVLLGTLFLKERLRPAQMIAVALATLGVLVLVIAAGQVPWVALFLGFSFGFYGLLRKLVKVDTMIAVFIEAAVLVPAALVFLVWRGGAGSFGGGDLSTDLLLVAAGLVTLVPLVWFGAAAKRLSLSTVGILQYVAPTGQFLLAVLLFGEAFTPIHMITFACIWTGLALYTADALRRG
ncbi:MAG: EamA family transporter RarD [Alphaproteobacteria bacterium]|nr:EamA family transporter RarD [Alphaproteobacteria bacterium]MBU0795919.1 EamA family transporter RarD [Alphaproteobacteria bacterium]MBU0886956.1 EamA family transporter RarD [Alphaproteobacteria bacterium]MBU1813188.1 EamA family transporter RarD [Alphaproteobacteria bacterium]